MATNKIMQVLSIEEKAKRYDVAVNEIKNLRDMLLKEGIINKNGIICKNFNRIFPELKESTEINPSEFDLRLNKLLKQFETLPKEELASSLSFYLNVVQNNGTYKEEKKDEQKSTDTQKSVEWEPQTGDTFRKKGTTSPTYHLCEKQEDSIIFNFVENREVGISGGEITLFALKRDYELVERPKSIEDVVEEELNKALQTKAEQKHTEWSDTDYVMQRAALEILMASPKTVAFTILKESVIVWLQSLKDRLQPKQDSTDRFFEGFKKGEQSVLENYGKYGLCKLTEWSKHK
jgi:hypothetical protein